MKAGAKEKIAFHKADMASGLVGKWALQGFLVRVFLESRVPLEQLDYVFCSDEYLLELNQRYLGHDEFTDIITFDLSEGKSVVGEIYISVERVRENARLFGASYQRELRRVIFHGALHLIGYADKLPDEKRAMRSKEDSLLLQFAQFLKGST
jgi:rRNA maturation RNase YbeY